MHINLYSARSKHIFLNNTISMSNICLKFDLCLSEIRTFCGCSGGQLRQHPDDASDWNNERHRCRRRERSASGSVEIRGRQRHFSSYHIANHHVRTRHANTARYHGEDREIRMDAEDQTSARSHSSYGCWMFVSIHFMYWGNVNQ